jgi:hypothetical protein
VPTWCIVDCAANSHVLIIFLQTFGLGGVSKQPMRVNATLLPPAKLQYGGRGTLEPGLAGTWNIGRNTLYKPATAASSRGSGGGKILKIIV